MQEEVQQKSVALIIKVGTNGGKLTAKVLKWAIRQHMQHKKSVPQGKQTVKQLVRQGAGVKTIPITKKNIKSFERVARKYGVDFALKKERGTGRYLVFFKARDEDALNAAFSRFAKKTVHRGRRRKPSIRAQLAQLTRAVRKGARAVARHMSKGGVWR